MDDWPHVYASSSQNILYFQLPVVLYCLTSTLSENRLFFNYPTSPWSNVMTSRRKKSAKSPSQKPPTLSAKFTDIEVGVLKEVHFGNILWKIATRVADSIDKNLFERRSFCQKFVEVGRNKYILCTCSVLAQYRLLWENRNERSLTCEHFEVMYSMIRRTTT